MKENGKGKRRIWRKVHLAICPDTHEIVMSELTTSEKDDASVAKGMIPKLPGSVRTIYGDGAYDREAFRREAYIHGIESIAPPRRGGRLRNEKKKPWMKGRNDAIRAVVGLGDDDEARKIWKILMRYHRRSLGETAMFRFKELFGGDFRSRTMENQKAELYAKSKAMNKMTNLGMPRGVWV